MQKRPLFKNIRYSDAIATLIKYQQNQNDQELSSSEDEIESYDNKKLKQKKTDEGESCYDEKKKKKRTNGALNFYSN